MEIKQIEKIEKFVNSLPDAEKGRAVLVVEGKIFSWESILKEFKKGGPLSKKVLKELEEKLK